MSTVFGLHEKEGLYELEVSPLYADDDRKNTLPSWDLTLEDDPLLWQESAKKEAGRDRDEGTHQAWCVVLVLQGVVNNEESRIWVDSAKL